MQNKAYSHMKFLWDIEKIVYATVDMMNSVVMNHRPDIN